MNQDLHKLVESRFSEAKEAKSDYTKRWRTYMQYADGDQWRDKNGNKVARPSWKASLVRNFCFAYPQAIMPVLTDNRPRGVVRPRRIEDEPLAELLEAIDQFLWDVLNIERSLISTLHYSTYLGTGIKKIGFDPKQKGGIGEVEVGMVSPFYFFPDPYASQIEECEYVGYVRPVRVSELKRRYPNARLSADAEWSAFDFEEGKTQKPSGLASSQETIYSVVTAPETPDTSKTSSVMPSTARTATGRTLVKEFWHRDASGKILCTVTAGGEVLKHIESPFTDGRFPFVKFIDMERPGEFWGVGEIHQIKNMQDDFNRVISAIHDELIRHGQRGWVVDREANIEIDKLTSAPNIVVEKNRGTDVVPVRAEGPPMQWFEYANELRLDLRTITGVTPALQGMRPEGIIAGKAIEALQEASLSIIRMKQRHMGIALKALGELMMSRVTQFYKEPRVIRIAPDLAQRLQEQSGTLGSISQVNEGSAFWSFKAEDLAGQWDYLVEPGSALSTTQQARLAQTMMLYQLGIIDKEMFVKLSDIPNRQQILQKIQQAGEMEGQMQAEAMIAQRMQTQGAGGRAVSQQGST